MIVVNNEKLSKYEVDASKGIAEYKKIDERIEEYTVLIPAKYDENGKILVEEHEETHTNVIPIMDMVYRNMTAEEAEYIKASEPTAEQKAKAELAKTIREKKALLNKYREDVEQVDLFGMERADYAEKKELCKQLVYELRELEKN